MVLGCSAPGCDVCRVPSTAIADVFVRGSAGVPLGGVDIQVLAYSDTCGGRFLAGEGPLRSDAEGYRRVSMTTLDLPQVAQCLRVIVLPGSNPTHPNGTVDLQTVLNFHDDRTPAESVRLDVVVGQ